MARPSPTYAGTKELKALGRAVRKLRLAVGLSQEALAYEAGIDHSYLGGIERGEHNVAVINLVKICECVSAKPSELFATAGL